MVQPSELLTTAEAARLLGITRRQVLELAAAHPQFPASQAAATGGRTWPRAGIQAWAAAHPSTDPVFTGPKVPPVPYWPPQVRQVMTFAAKESSALNHPWDDLDHLVLGMLHPDCPGAARAVLESFGARVETLRQALIDSLGDPFDKTSGAELPPASQLALERANLEAARLADAEVSSEHVLLALTGRWDQDIVTGWLARCGITAEAIRRRVADVTEGVALPDPVPLGEPVPREPVATGGLTLARNPLGKDPLRRKPWSSVAFQVPQGRPIRPDMIPRQYFLDRDGYPVFTTDGRPVHFVVDEDLVPVLDQQGRYMLGPVEVPPGGTVTAGQRGGDWPLRPDVRA
jgi:predicted DNA-binding transcriptional regulator AlpA